MAGLKWAVGVRRSGALSGGQVLLAALLSVTLALSAPAQAAQPGDGLDLGLHMGPDMGPEAAPVDSMAWRVKACSACHGDQGRASPEGYFPRLAGKPADYLFRQMLNFRDARRSHTQMSYLLANLSDDYLREMAAYFAQREVPYPAPLRAQAQSAVLAQGQALVMQGDAARGLPACVACHGAAMTGVLPAVPGLLGLSRDYLNSQLGAWRTGARHAQAPDCMAAIARKLSVQEVAALSAWLAAQPVPQGGKPLAQLPGAAPMACAGMDADNATRKEGR